MYNPWLYDIGTLDIPQWAAEWKYWIRAMDPAVPARMKLGECLSMEILTSTRFWAVG